MRACANCVSSARSTTYPHSVAARSMCPTADRPFRDLQIDFETLEKRKANEFEKLEQVIRYATTNHCRQLEILDYFGDPAARAVWDL